ncbi:hypothetical protein SAMN05216474_2478 [Lishizhenia tianjinensis]|uniref:Uncharacterized protein n=1 Tax=Lishizhenia tianjinensis TaxID=477690 RepID=A0A1I7B220_9FLAO|nr:hypothetical protein [Lishizhenia tianjinensis]SFT81236.1 hypothetical protein SAMN05216474_2478 [Lishizhenia tianjinensis]
MKFARKIETKFQPLLKRYGLDQQEELSNAIAFSNGKVTMCFLNEKDDILNITIGNGWSIPLWLISKLFKLDIENFDSFNIEQLEVSSFRNDLINEFNNKLKDILEGDLSWYSRAIKLWRELGLKSNIKIEFIDEKGNILNEPDKYMRGGKETLEIIKESTYERLGQDICNKQGIIHIEIDTTGTNFSVVNNVTFENMSIGKSYKI